MGQKSGQDPEELKSRLQRDIGALLLIAALLAASQDVGTTQMSIDK